LLCILQAPLIYEPFLTGASGGAGVKGGIDILDAHSGALRYESFSLNSSD